MEFAQLLREIGVDEAKTLERFGGMEAILKKFILKFPEDPTYGRLAEAIARGAMEDVEREVHTLKGVAGNLGISGLYEICSACLDCLRRQETAPLPGFYQRIQAEYERVTALICAFCA